MRIIFILFILTLPISTSAQNRLPGSQKILIGAEMGFMPIVGSYQIQEDFWDFNMKYTFKIEYKPCNFFGIGLKLHRTEDVVELGNFAVTSYTPLEILSNVSYGGYGSSERISSEANYSYTGFGPFMKIYTQSFDSARTTRVFFNFEYHFGKVNVSDDGRYFNNSQTEIHSLKAHTFSTGVGIEKLFFKHLNIDLSCNIGYFYEVDKMYAHYLRLNRYVTDIQKKGNSDNLFIARIGLAWLFF